MADDTDVPPLEDMTEILKKADALRENRNSGSQTNGTAKQETVKAVQKAKVTKNPGGRVISGKQVNNMSASKKETAAASGTGLFGGMKKGFLFGNTTKGQQKTYTITTEAVTKTAKTEEIPFIAAKSESGQSGLTLDEVQQAMSEAKGLLNSQDWITDDLLTKIEKNETLQKRFGDPSFMKALEDFQKQPEEAMRKYEGNTEVENFLQEFCGLLGNHFTDLGNTSRSASTTHSTKPGAAMQSSLLLSSSGRNEKLRGNRGSAKIVELAEDADSAEEKAEKSRVASSKKSPDKEKLFSEGDKQTKPARIASVQDDFSGQNPQFMYQPGAGLEKHGTDKPPMADDEVREVLKDKRVMETLMDPEIMKIVQLLRSDPEKAQRIVDGATGELKERITFLILKGLLRFQAH